MSFSRRTMRGCRRIIKRDEMNENMNSKFCWICGKWFRGDYKYVFIDESSIKHYVHKQCKTDYYESENEDYYD